MNIHFNIAPHQTKEQRVGVVFFAFSASLILLTVSYLFITRVALALLFDVEWASSFGYLLDLGGVFVLCTTIAALVAYIVHLRLTDRIRAETLAQKMTGDLLQSRERFRVLYDSSPVPYFLMDKTGKIESPNKATLRFFGAKEEQCAAMSFYDMVVEDGSNAHLLDMLRAKVERGIHINQVELQVKNTSGVARWVLLSIYPSARNAPVGHKHLVALVDITAEKEVDRIKTDFVSLASHQLRMPLTTVKWYIDYLVSSPTVQLADEVRPYLDKIYTGNERMIALVATLLNVSRIDMGTIPVTVTQVSLDELANDVYDELQPEAERKELMLKLKLLDLRTIESDRMLLRICLQNLVSNGIRYTPEHGTVETRIACSNAQCTIEVSDTGVGIPLEAHHRVFSKMYRADNAKKVDSKGNGFGLYMTKAFVEKLGGTVTFESVLNEGTTFTITLPPHAPHAG